MKEKVKMLVLTLLTALILAQTAAATSSLTIGAVTYDSTMVKDESFTLSTSIQASSVSSTITVTVELQDNTGSAVSITSPTKTLTFTQSETQTVQWNLKAITPGTYSNPFTITATASDGGNANPKTTTTTLTIKERPVLKIITSQSKTSVNNDNTVQLNYTIQNTAATGAASATDITATLAIPSGWSLTTGDNPQSKSSIAAGGAQSSGYWILTANSPSTTNTITLTVGSSLPGGTITETYTITGPSSNNDGSSGGGGGGGAGGSTSGEAPENIAVKEKYYEHVYKDIETTYTFKAEGNPVSEVKITGNVNAGETIAMVEVLKNQSSLIQTPPSGKVYTHLNIWVGTSGFATPKNIKTATITFNVENNWIDQHNAKPDDIILQRYSDDVDKWEVLATSITDHDNTKTSYQATTNHFSPFAITIKPDTTSTTQPTTTTKTETLTGNDETTPTTTGETEEPTQPKTPCFTALLSTIAITATIVIKKRRKV